MRIVIATVGSRGDVQPYINLAQGLLDAGHDVRIASNPTVGALVEAHGVPFVPVGPPVDMGAEGALLLEKSGGNMWLSMIRVMQLGARLIEEAYSEVLEACRDADLVITSDSTSGIAEAQKLGKPWISVTLQPGRLPANPAGGIQRLAAGLIGKAFVAPTNRFRRRVGAPLVADITSMMSSRLILLPVSTHVASRGSGWPGQVRQTGYWFARDKEWQPPTDLTAFLQSGDRPIAVSLGVMSTSGKTAEQSARIVLDAVERSGVRAILQGWDAMLLESLGAPETVYRAGSLPHGWLFGQVAAVIHHGGFGTTAAGLRSGVPSIVIPHIIDQYAWGQIVEDIGVGPTPIPRAKLTAESLASRITQALNDDGMRTQAARIGAAIREEPDGVTAAVRTIEDFCEKGF